MEYHHRQIHHGGHQATLAVIRQEFWPIQGKRVVAAILRHCQRCFRFNPKPIQQPIGQLPSARVRSARPFFYNRSRLSLCIDGQLAEGIHRSIHLFHYKGNPSSAGLIAALRRFIGHHGCPKEIHSDNATNFQGARHELNDLFKSLHSKSGQQTIGTELSLQEISWHFIPPRAPNSGGLWEAADRSAKTALKKEIDGNQLTREKCCTLLVQISIVR